ncbi:MAG: twin-arginine translocase TatA/TatE family subunit [Pseudomonadota bacterium]
MSIAELLIILFVALLVLGPKELKRLAHFVGRVSGYLRDHKQQWLSEVNDYKKQIQLEENIQRAEAADKTYNKPVEPHSES